MENKNIELFNPLDDDNRYTYNELSRSFKTNFNPEKNELFVSLFNEFDEGKDTNKNKIKYKNVKKNIKEIKTKFYFIISILYYSLYLLCIKIISKLPIPEIPSLGVSSFMICFNN